MNSANDPFDVINPQTLSTVNKSQKINSLSFNFLNERRILSFRQMIQTQS